MSESNYEVKTEYPITDIVTVKIFRVPWVGEKRLVCELTFQDLGQEFSWLEALLEKAFNEGFEDGQTSMMHLSS